MPRSRCFVATNCDCNTCVDIDTYGHSPLRNRVVERMILKLATFVGPTEAGKWSIFVLEVLTTDARFAIRERLFVLRFFVAFSTLMLAGFQ